MEPKAARLITAVELVKISAIASNSNKEAETKIIAALIIRIKYVKIRLHLLLLSAAYILCEIEQVGITRYHQDVGRGVGATVATV